MTGSRPVKAPKKTAAKKTAPKKTARSAAKTSTQGDPVERIIGGVQTDIFNGQLLPGDRLDERGLAARFGTSRTPVRVQAIPAAAVDACVQQVL